MDFVNKFRFWRNNKRMLIRFIIYGLLGMNMEIIWTGLGSISNRSADFVGHTSLWMFFIYGLAVVFLEPVHDLISGQNWFLRGCVWTTMIFMIEFFSGGILRLAGIEAWRYTGEFSVLGLIRLDYAPVWFAVGLLFERVHNMLTAYNIG